MNNIISFVFGMGFGIIWIYFWVWLIKREITKQEEQRMKDKMYK